MVLAVRIENTRDLLEAAVGAVLGLGAIWLWGRHRLRSREVSKTEGEAGHEDAGRPRSELDEGRRLRTAFRFALGAIACGLVGVVFTYEQQYESGAVRMVERGLAIGGLISCLVATAIGYASVRREERERRRHSSGPTGRRRPR